MSANHVLRARGGIVLLCVCVSAIAVVPFFFMGQPLPGGSRWDVRMPDTHDMWLDFDQMRDFYRGVASGEIYPRWEEDTNYGFGAPTTCFYPPGFYYLTALLYPLLRNWTVVLLGAFLLLMIASGGAAYLLARRCMSRIAAAVTMIAYALFPYHAIDQYRRGALSELVAFACMPLILLFVDRLFTRERKLAAFAGLALSWGAFLWAHPPSAYQFAMAMCPFLLVLAWLRRNWSGLLWTGGGLTLGLGLSAAYLYPAAVEENLIHHEILGQIWPYHATYLFMYAGYSKAYFEFFQLLNVSWCFYAAAIVAGIVVLSVIRWRGDRSLLVFWTAMGCFASFMMLHVSAPIGRRIPMIEIGVLSWRMLSICTLVAALLAGAFVQVALEARGGRRVFAAVLAVGIVVGGITFTVLGVMAPVNDNPAFQPWPAHTNYVIIPRDAPAHTNELPKLGRAALDPPGGTILIREWKPQHRVIGVTGKGAARLFVRTFNFPGWTASIDGRPVPIATDTRTGAILLDLSAGDHLVTLGFMDTPDRRLGAWVSGVSLALTAAILVAGAVIAL